MHFLYLNIKLSQAFDSGNYQDGTNLFLGNTKISKSGFCTFESLTEVEAAFVRRISMFSCARLFHVHDVSVCDIIRCTKKSHSSYETAAAGNRENGTVSFYKLSDVRFHVDGISVVHSHFKCSISAKNLLIANRIAQMEIVTRAYFLENPMLKRLLALRLGQIEDVLVESRKWRSKKSKILML